MSRDNWSFWMLVAFVVVVALGAPLIVWWAQ